MALSFEKSNYLNGAIDLLSMSLYTKTHMDTEYMDYEVFVASALAGGAAISGLVGIALLRAVGEIIKIALERKRGQARDNIDNIGNYTGTIPTFQTAITTLGAESGIPPQVFIECVYPIPAQPDYANYIYKDWVFPRSVSFHFLNYPRGFQGDTEDRRRDRRGRGGDGGDGAPPPAGPPPAGPPPFGGGFGGGGGSGGRGGGSGYPPPPDYDQPPIPRKPYKNPQFPESTSKQADWYQKSNLYQRKMRAGDVQGRSYQSGQNNPLYSL